MKLDLQDDDVQTLMVMAKTIEEARKQGYDEGYAKGVQVTKMTLIQQLTNMGQLAESSMVVNIVNGAQFDQLLLSNHGLVKHQ